ncbi:sulfurtransferase [Rhodophyticola sp. SM2404]
MKLLTYALTSLFLLASTAIAELGPLASPEQLNAELAANSVTILDIRATAAAEGEENVNTFTAGHIEGSVNAPYGLFRGPSDNPGQLRSDEDLTAVIRQIGLSDLSQPVVISYQGANVTDFGAAARVYWTLKSLGFTELSILNGGVNAWVEAGYTLSTDAVAPAPSTLSVSIQSDWLATVEDVQAVVSGDDTALLLDARPESFWSGNSSHPAAARPGTLPQSQYFEHANWFGAGPAVIDAEAVRLLAEAEGFAQNDQLVSFCNTGHWAATNWFALSELAGIENVKLFPESMVGWSNAGYEMANVPGPVRTLWNQIKNIF